MTATRLVAAAAGLLLAAGVLLLLTSTVTGGGMVAAWTRRLARRRRITRGLVRRSGWWRARWPAAVLAGLTVAAATGWPVAGAITAVTVAGLPVLLATSREAAADIDRIEAVEAWTRHLADVLATGTGLEQALTVTARTAPAPIQDEVTALVARLGAGWSTPAALRGFADDLDDATADLVVAALLLAAGRRGPGLAHVLAGVADTVAEQITMRRKVEAERARPRATARAVTLITLAVLGLGALNTDYLTPYRSGLGQLVLAGIAGLFVAALAWMRAMTLTDPAPRLLTVSDQFTADGSALAAADGMPAYGQNPATAAVPGGGAEQPGARRRWW